MRPALNADGVLAWFTCPHCLGNATKYPSCHACDGSRQVDYPTLEKALQKTWGKRDCPCAVCRSFIGRKPPRIEVTHDAA